MKVADGVEMLELEMNMMGRISTIHPTVVYDGKDAVLIDVGLPGQLSAIQSEMANAGIPIDHVRAIVLTHQDIDHIGGIRDVLAAIGKPVDVYAHADDKPYIEGDREPIKMNRARIEQMLAAMPEEMRQQAESMFSNLPTAKITKVVADGDHIPLCGGLTVIFTPGHTPGHISLYVNGAKTLITGDATASDNGRIVGPSPQATPDMTQALESQKKFTQFDIDKAICYHGGLVDQNVNQQFRELAQA